MKVTALLENTFSRSDIEAEHGLSLYLETAKHRILFDTGQTDAFARNAARLGIDLASVDMAVLSHGHYDHTGGLRRFLELNKKAPIFVNEHAFEPHIKKDGRNIGMEASLQRHKQIIMTGDFLELDEEVSLRTCNGMSALYEDSSAGMFTLTEGKLQQDAFLHEQFLCLNIDGRRMVVSACSHKGILNICHWLHPDIFIGGFHFMGINLSKAGRERLNRTADSLLSQKTIYYTCHCTGAEPYLFLKKRMGEKLQYLSGGQTLVF